MRKKTKMMGRKHSEETKRKISSLVHKDQKNFVWNRGKSFSEEYKNKISALQKRM